MKAIAIQTAQPTLKTDIKWYPVGHDFGNADTVDVFNIGGKPYRSSAPSAFCRVDATAIRNLSHFEMPQSEALGAGAKKGKGKKAKNPGSQSATSATPSTTFSAIQLQGESITNAVGDFALSQGKKVWSGRGDHKRYATKYSVLALLVRAAEMTTEKEFGLFVVTGLPADLYTKHFDLRKEIKEALDGTYVFSLDGGETWRTAHIIVSLVVMEGAGALLAYSTRMKLVMTKSTMGACIDIGGGTVDLYVARGAQPIAEYCKSDRTAVEAAAQLVREIFASRHPGGGLTDLEIREIMYAHVNKDGQYAYPQVSIFGEPIDEEELAEIVHEAISQVAGEIVTFVTSAWREADSGARFEPLLLVGGGYKYFFDEIKERIPHIKVLDPEQLGEFFPTDANSEGFAQIAASRLAKQQAMDKEAMEQRAAQQAQVEQQQDAIVQASEQSLLEEEELQHAAATASATQTVA